MKNDKHRTLFTTLYTTMLENEGIFVKYLIKVTSLYKNILILKHSCEMCCEVLCGYHYSKNDKRDTFHVYLVWCIWGVREMSIDLRIVRSHCWTSSHLFPTLGHWIVLHNTVAFYTIVFSGFIVFISFC